MVFLLIPLLRIVAVRIGFVDKPNISNERKIHRQPIPLAGGVAMYIGFMCVYLIFARSFNTRVLAVLGGSLLILAIGIVDDWYKTRGKEYPAFPKFVVQLGAAVIIYFAGIKFTGFFNPLTNSYVLLPSWIQFIFTVTWIFGVTTVINFSDGMDGLAGGLSSISATTLFVVALSKGQTGSAMMAIILAGVALSYLNYNRPPAKVFMGDAGATFLGFVLGIIALDGAFKQATVLSLFIPILALGLPIFDNIYVVIRRALDGKPVYKADATQVHYRLLSAGLSQKQVVGFLYLVSICFSLTSIIILLLHV